MSEIKSKVLQALRQVDTSADSASICIQVDVMYGYQIDEVDAVLIPLFESWPESSGDPAFPVEGDVYGYCKDGKWDTETERGRRRHRLLAYLIESLEAEVEA